MIVTSVKWIWMWPNEHSQLVRGVLSLKLEFERLCEVHSKKKCEERFSCVWQQGVEEDERPLREGIRMWPLQMFEHLTVSPSGRALRAKCPRGSQSSPGFFSGTTVWHYMALFPSPHWAVHAGSECCKEQFYWLVELVPSPPVPSTRQGVGGRAGGQADEHMWAQGQAQTHQTFIQMVFPWGIWSSALQRGHPVIGMIWSKWRCVLMSLAYITVYACN